MQDETRNQDRLRPHPVNQHADGHLRDKGRDKIDGHDETEFGIGYAKRRLDQEKQRRQHKLVKVTDQMCRTHQPNGLVLAKFQRRGKGGHDRALYRHIGPPPGAAVEQDGGHGEDGKGR